MLCLQDIVGMSKCSEQEITEIVTKEKVPETIAYVIAGQTDQFSAKGSAGQKNHFFKRVVKTETALRNRAKRTFRRIPVPAAIFPQSVQSTTLS